MKIVFKDNLLLKNILELFKDAVMDATIKCRNDGIFLQSMDSSHISMASFKLGPDVFDIFEYNNDIDLGLNLETLHKILKVVTKGDELGLESNDNNTDQVTITIKNADTKKEYMFDMKLMDIESEELEVPPLIIGWRVSIDSSEFLKNVSVLMDFGDSIEIGCTDGKMYFKMEGDIANAMICNETTCEWVGNQTLKKDVISKFTGRLLKMYGSGKKITKNIQFVIAPDQPITIRYNITENSCINMFIAPKVIDANMEN